MNRFALKFFWLASAVVFGVATGTLAETPSALPPPRRTAAATNSVPLPPLPVMHSPVDFFRELLAMTPAERHQALTNRSPELRARLLSKLREYETLKPDEREVRLRATELRWYLVPLMSEPATNRAVRLALLPAELRPLIEERLQRWDLLPVPLQQELLNNEMTARYFGQLTAASKAEKQKILGQLSPDRRAKLEAGIDRWRGLNETQRDQTLAGFNAFFELTPKEKTKALNTLSEAERQQMEKTLQAYAALTPAQRSQCLRSFEKFASLSLPERQMFLKSAERWQLMPPAERQAWRDLVRVVPLQPPLPPPLAPRHAPAVATNQN